MIRREFAVKRTVERADPNIPICGVSLNEAAAFARAITYRCWMGEGDGADVRAGGSRTIAMMSEILRSFADATTDYPRLLETIAERVALFVGHYCSIRLLTDDGEHLETVAMYEPIAKHAPSIAVLARHPIRVDDRLRGALLSGKGFIDADIRSDEVVANFPAELRESVLAFPTRSVIVAPLCARGQAMGALFIVRRGDDTPPLRPEDLELAEGLAAHAALAIANARTLDQLQHAISKREEADASRLQAEEATQSVLHVLERVSSRLGVEERVRRRALLFQSMSEAVISGDTEFRIEEWNPAAERLFGWSAEEVFGKRVQDVITTVKGVDREQTRESVRDGNTAQGRVTVQRRDGAWRTVEYSSVPVKAADGTTHGFVSSMLDVTNRVHLEAELQTRVAELEAANAELESFSYSVSHDLRAPVRAIDGFAKILEEDYGQTLDDEGRRLLEIIRRNSARMGHLIDDLLSFSRSSRQSMRTVEVDMTEIANAAFQEAIASAEDRRFELVLEPLPRANVDRALITQVWVNLATNAVKYTRGRDPAVIHVRATRTANETVYQVTDNGVGFDMAYAGKLFGVFERLHPNAQFEGTGVGLALVKRIVERHRGKVWAESAIDRGTTLSFSIPEPGPVTEVAP